MALLIIGLILFFGIHFVPTNRELRDGLAKRLGAGGYMGLFSLVSFAALALIVIGYNELQLLPANNPVLWEAPVWTRHLAMGLMLPAFILLLAAYVPSRIRTALKHPMLVAVKLWALAHIIANGDLASLLLFGSFLAYAVFDRISLKSRAGGGLGPLGAREAGSAINDVFVVIAGAALFYAFLKWGHPALIGVPIIPA